MNKAAVKDFAIRARNKLIADITYKAGLLGITDKEMKSALPQSTNDLQFFEIGMREPYSISGKEVEQRKKLVEVIQRQAEQSDYPTALKSVIEEVAYTWFNRLIAIRFMEINGYLPSNVRVLSSENSAKIEPDIVTKPYETGLRFSPYEKDRISQLAHNNMLDELFRMLFIKQCNTLNEILPNLFEKTSDYTELLLNVSFTDKEGIVYRLVHYVEEDDFNISKEGQVEIIGWLYQYYNTEPKDETFDLLNKNVKITKERIPAATQLFTPDWIVRYMVENSLGRLWLEGHPNDVLKINWKYYLDEAEQEPEVKKQLEAIREEYKLIKPESIKLIDPCMGSGHILVYAFDVLIQIYESAGYSPKDAAKKILENNLVGLDIDERAFQLAYFAVMMKARQYDKRILSDKAECLLYSIKESNQINRRQLQYFGAGMNEAERSKAILQIKSLLDVFVDAKEYGSILKVEDYDWELLNHFASAYKINNQISMDVVDIKLTQVQLYSIIRIGAVMAEKYDVVVTNPPYMGMSNGTDKLRKYVKKYYPDSKADLFAVFIEKCGQMTKRNCFQAMITQHAWMFLSSFEKLRKKLLSVDTVNMAHLGARAFEEIGGEVVQTTSWIQRKTNISNYRSTYAKLVDNKSQKTKEESFLAKKYLHVAYKENFSKIPGSPIAYWVSETIINVFSKGTSLNEISNTRQGMIPGNTEAFVRLWYEVDIKKVGFDHKSSSDILLYKKKWFPYNKGGEFRRWYGNIEHLINMEDNGHDIKHSGLNNNYRLRNPELYFKEAVTWSKISSGVFSVRYMPQGCMFDIAGCCIYDLDNILNYIMGLCNSIIVTKVLNIISPTLNYEVDHIKKIPVILVSYKLTTNESVAQCVKISKSDWDSFETSWDFKTHPLISNSNSSHTLESAFSLWKQHCDERFNQLKANEEELNRIFIEIYGLQDELTPEVEDKDVTVRKSDLARDIKSLISYAVGCMFGRYSLDSEGLAYAGGHWDESKYTAFIPDKDNILPITDEEYFTDDIVGLFVAFVKKVYGAETLEENLDFIAKALGNRGNTSREIIRNYFVKDFFKEHCRVYKKRPIFWLFDSGKADGFKALIYLHRYDENTIGNLRIDYLHRLQRIYESEINSMQEIIENGSGREVTQAQKRREKLVKQLKEIKEYDEKIAHLALARISLDLDDGVAVNYDKVQTGKDGIKLEVLAKI